MLRKLLAALLVLALAGSLAACGKKNAPKHPRGSDFPREYPTE
jgi:predicted small lipoprotein YifL